jgi:hypothetical protein
VFLHINTSRGQSSAYGGADISSISFSVVATKYSDAATISVGGIARASSKVRLPSAEWLTEQLFAGESLSFCASQAEHLDSESFPQFISRCTSPPLTTRKLNENSRRIRAIATYMPNGSVITAEIASQEQVQLVLTWSNAKPNPILEVDSLTTANSGYTRGKRWVEMTVPLDEVFRVELTA